MPVKKLKKVLKKKKVRARRAKVKHIQLGGSYPHRGRGKLGGGGPYYITREPEKQPEQQTAPWTFKDAVEFAKLSQQGSTSTLQTAIAIGSLATTVSGMAERAYAWKYPQEAAEQKAATEVKKKFGDVKGTIDAGMEVLEEIGEKTRDTASNLFGNYNKVTKEDVAMYLQSYPNQTFANVTEQQLHFENFLKSQEYQTVPTPNELTPMYNKFIGAAVASSLVYGSQKLGLGWR